MSHKIRSESGGLNVHKLAALMSTPMGVAVGASLLTLYVTYSFGIFSGGAGDLTPAMWFFLGGCGLMTALFIADAVSQAREQHQP